MTTPQTDDTVIITEKLKQLTEAVFEVKKAREESEGNIKAIGKVHRQMQDEPDKPYYKLKLKKLYKCAITDCDNEANSIQACLDKLAAVRNTLRKRPRRTTALCRENTIRRGQLMKMLLTSAQTMPLFVPRRRNEEPPPLCGCTPPSPTHICKPGDLVCALTKQPVESADETDSNWILAEVVSFNTSLNRYEIDDIDEEQKERHTLSRRRVIPLANLRANPDTNPEAVFEKGSPVLALYPQTTCFYRGIIHKPPSTAHEDYSVLFEDPSYPEGYSPPLPVPQRYVIADPKL